jgi:hypothetical protein
MNTPARRVAALALMAGGLLGCHQSEDPQLVSHRARLLLDSEPAGATSIADARQNLEMNSDVVVVGRVAFRDDEPFVDGKAAFFITELLPEGHNHGSADHDDCPFCKWRTAQAPVAAIQFLDETGELLPHDARGLFRLSKGEVVVVRGQAKLEQELDALTISATGVHVRQSSPPAESGG